MRSYRDVEKRLAELERQTAWQQRAAERPRVCPYDDDTIAEILRVMYECYALPRIEDYPDEEAWWAAVVAEWNRLHRSQFSPYPDGCGDPACEVCSVRSDD